MAIGRSSLAFETNDPLTLALAPPPNESEEERRMRLLREAHAKKISDEIDSQLQAESAALKKRKKPVKVLLLGQSESGKSTTLKNFQLNCSPKKWAEERASWRSVIHLNLTRSVNTIVDFLAHESEFSADNGPIFPTDTHRTLMSRLEPLRKTEKNLERRLGSGATEEIATNYAGDEVTRPSQEFFVRSGWKAAMERLRPHVSLGSRSARERDADDAAVAISGCREDMKALWEDSTVKDIVRYRRIRLGDSAEFFLNHIDRVARVDYEPTNDDVVRARLRTVGVQEHRIVYETGADTGREVLFYDVGGSRSSRAAWCSFFDDVNAIIFLAPINCFDEKLAEDRSVNRLEDSFLLWKSVCCNKLLANTQLVLFLNKCDLLEKKLRSGVVIKKYMPSYGDRANDAATVTQYFRRRFVEMSKHYSPAPRTVHVHLTSVVDTEATAVTLSAVQEGILRNHLRQLDLI